MDDNVPHISHRTPPSQEKIEIPEEKIVLREETLVPADKTLTKKERASRGALFIPACLLLGFGLGYVAGNILAGATIGLGMGIIIFAISLFSKD